MSLRLRPFRPEDEEVALAAQRALAAEEFTFLLGYREGVPWQEWIQQIEHIRTGADIPPDMVRSAMLAAEVEGDLVGRVSVRFELNDWLARQGGHIGYGVVPEFRRRGYATEILRQAIELAHQEGVDRILVICNEDNVGSATVIERCGGVLEGRATSDEGRAIRRYWI
ncbi:MAG TPA: GNAT family N-acetyltransferase [Acidimicrobiales bacterium]